MEQDGKAEGTAFERLAETYESFPDLPAVPGAILNQWLSRCSVVPTNAREWDCTAEWHQKPRRFAEVFLYWFQRGDGWFRLNGAPKPCRVCAGELLLIPEKVLHEVWTSEPLKVYTARFSARVYGAIDLLSLLGAAGVFPAAAHAPYQRVSATLAREHVLQTPGWRAAMAAAIRELLLYVVRNHGSLLKPGPADMRQRDLVRMQPVMDLVQRRLGDPSLRVADLAASISVSEVCLRKLFHRGVGLSPVGFLRRRRIDRACALLRGTDRPVKAIAEVCGFRDLPFFYRTFRRGLSTTPGAYRNAEEV